MNYSDANDVWIKRYNMLDSDWLDRYIYSFYFSTITTLTVGYGDIVPVSIFLTIIIG